MGDESTVQSGSYLAVFLHAAAGIVLCLYTAGLVARRGESIDEGLERLRATVEPESAETVCVKVMTRLLNAHIAQDDVAVLVLRRLPAHL